MKLQWIQCKEDTEKYMHPQGFYWYASTDDEGYDGSGDTQLEAVANLVDVLSQEVGTR